MMTRQKRRKNPKNRSIRAPLCPILIPIYHAPDLETFKTCFRSIFEATHKLHELGLQSGDIRPDSMLYDGDNLGVKIDWDIAGSPMAKLPPVAWRPFTAQETLNDKRY